MQGLMMDTPLLVSDLIRHADRHHHDAQIVSKRVEGDTHRYTYRDAHTRSRQVANALRRLGVELDTLCAAISATGERVFGPWR